MTKKNVSTNKILAGLVLSNRKIYRISYAWNSMLSPAYRASEVLEVLPDLEPELWEHILTHFLDYDDQHNANYKGVL